MFDILIHGGRIVDGSGNPWHYGDIGIHGERIAAIGRLAAADARHKIDATDKVVAPGFIDVHVHGDLALLADPLHEPAIRQGVTTYLLGQDGVAMAPASAPTLEYMARYTAGFSGGKPLADAHLPRRPLLTMADYLALFDRKCALNVACLVPNGNIRMEAIGLALRNPSPEELGRMEGIVRRATAEGAVGLSSGLDYIPSRYASTAELIALCREIAPQGGVYVSHMRSYAPDGVAAALDEMEQIAREAGVAVHVSHFNSLAEQVLPQIDAMRARGIDITFDLYCYLAGSSILGMVALPPGVQEGGIDVTLARLRDRQTREKLRDSFASPRGPLEKLRLSYVAAPEFQKYEGKTLEQAAKEAGSNIPTLVCDLLVASGMAVGCIAPHHPRRTEADIRAFMRHPAMMGGSDGIFTGRFPHPRGYGCFARYLGHYVREEVWTLEECVQKLAGHPARRFGLKDRGFLREKMAADVIVFTPNEVSDRATFEHGRELATGMEHVIVNGEMVLHSGQRTRGLPGRALKMG
ncbi:MAG TPA: D-aminoacylase [Gemmataceae bacterium]|nr:D-aminoacylase [Gemmataceae bacterium]